MSEDLHHECGVAALYFLEDGCRTRRKKTSPVARERRGLPPDGPVNVAAMMPSMLMDLQNRGQLAAGMSSWNGDVDNESSKREQILDTYKQIGTVIEAFRLSRPDAHKRIIEEYAGPAVIGHTRYATCGLNDRRYAQPFERHHGRLWKWFSFAFNGNIANYAEIRKQIVEKGYVLTLDTDAEILMHMFAYRLREDKIPSLKKMMAATARKLDGAYNIAFLDALGRMFVARDPLGIRPMNWVCEDGLFAAASESVALVNLGFKDIQTLEPGQMAIIENGKLRLERFAPKRKPSRCFFEWVYFSSVASEIDGSSVYQARSRLGQRLAEMEDQEIDSNSIVVPVPDTAKAPADAFAYQLGLPCLEGLIRNRHVGRTFIEPTGNQRSRARSKYTPLPAVLSGKRVFLVEDSIVRSTTLSVLAKRIREEGGAKEVHVRVACPPIVAPCFYGIDMSTFGELFAPKFAPKNYTGTPTKRMLKKMADALGLDSLRYLPTSALGPCLAIKGNSLCTGCINSEYPTDWGKKLFTRAKRTSKDRSRARTHEQVGKKKK